MQSEIGIASVIFVVDDDSELCEQTSSYLSQFGYQTETFHNIPELRTALTHKHCDLLLLDIMLPGEDGLSFFRNLGSDRPKVIILSALGDETSKVLALELGVEDYLVKPFSLRELLARIRNQLRRSRQSDEDRPCLRYRFAGWILDPLTRLLTSPDNLTHLLSGAEFRLLKVFLDHPGQVLDRDFLGKDFSLSSLVANDRVLEVQISKLRTRLEESGKNPKLILTSRGDGYSFGAQVEREYGG